MIPLPRDWHRLNSTGLLQGLQRRVTKDSDRAMLVSTLIWSSLEIAARTFPGGRNLRVRRRSRYSWGIGRLPYRYVPHVDDALIDRLERWMAAKSELILIAPDEQESILRRVLSTIDKNWMPTVWCVSGFLNYRVFCATIDMRTRCADVIRAMLTIYNGKIRSLGRDELAVDDRGFPGWPALSAKPLTRGFK